MLSKHFLFFLLLFSGFANAKPEVISDGAFDKLWAEMQSSNNGSALPTHLLSAESGDFRSALFVAANSLAGTPDKSSLHKAVNALSPFAEKGRPEARYLLAKLHLHPLIVDKNKSLVLLESLARDDWVPAMLLLVELGSEHWLQRAASLGSAEAQYLLAMHLFDQSMFQRANRLLDRSAAQGYLPAQKASAQKALNAEDYPVAVLWLSRAAESGDRDVLFELAVLYLNGLGVAHNYSLAMDLATRSAGSQRAALAFLQERLIIRNEVTAAGLSKLRRLVNQADYVEYLAKVRRLKADLSSELWYRAGFLLKNGVIETNYKQAREYYLRAAARGYLPAINSLGVLQEKGLGVERNIPAAKALYQLAAEQGYQKAMLNLVELSMDKQQFDEAGEWLARVTQKSSRLNKIKSRYYRLKPK